MMEEELEKLIAIPLEEYEKLYKSKMIVGSLVIMNTKHFSWLHKLMWRIILGIKIEDIKEER